LESIENYSDVPQCFIPIHIYYDNDVGDDDDNIDDNDVYDDDNDDDHKG